MTGIISWADGGDSIELVCDGHLEYDVYAYTREEWGGLWIALVDGETLPCRGKRGAMRLLLAAYTRGTSATEGEFIGPVLHPMKVDKRWALARCRP